MTIKLLPLLKVQRDLYTIPRGWERFRVYLTTLTGSTDDVVLPLMSMNPMGKEHIPALLDDLIAMNAEAVVAATIAEAVRHFPPIPIDLLVALVVTDDAQGGWTNRYFVEMSLRFDTLPLLKRGWIVVPIWTSETWSPSKIQAEVKAAIYRSVLQQQYGQPKTLQQMLTQEGNAAVFAWCYTTP